MKRAVAYIRRSAQSRTDPGDQSREFQTDTIRGRAAENGDDGSLLVLDGDWGRSGAGYGASDKTAERDDFMRLYSMVEAGEVSAIYVYSLDRLARSVEWSERIANACERTGTVIYDRKYRYDAADTRDRRDLRREAENNEDYSRQATTKRLATTSLQRARRDEHIATGCPGPETCGKVGLHHLGPAPYGLLEGEDADAVLAAFKDAGSYHGAARLLIERDVPSRRSHLTTEGGVALSWEASTVKRIVQRVAPELVPVRTRKGSRTLSIRPFSRLLLCPCGAVMTPHNTRDSSPAYLCREGHRSPEGTHPRPWVIREHVVLDWVRDMTSHLLQRTTFARLDDDTELNLGLLRDRRERLVEVYLAGDLTRDAYTVKLAAIDDSLERLEASKRSSTVWQLGVRWDAPSGEVNGQLRDLLASIRLGYVEDPGPKRGRHSGLTTSLVPVGAVWRRQPTIEAEVDRESVMLPHPDAVPADGGWYLPVRSADEVAEPSRQKVRSS